MSSYSATLNSPQWTPPVSRHGDKLSSPPQPHMAFLNSPCSLDAFSSPKTVDCTTLRKIRQKRYEKSSIAYDQSQIILQVRICMGSSEHNSAYISPPNRLILSKWAFLIMFSLNIPTYPVILQI